MKTVQMPENPDELQNVLVQEDVVLHLQIHDLEYELKGSNFSADRLSAVDIMNFITNALGDELGIVVTWNIG
jgi:hypothetical protein